jgi:putative membrane protein insertion efficiency factor
MKELALTILFGYRLIVSPFLPPSCRYFPSCSQYAYEAIEKHGALRGVALAVMRLLRCHPGHPGGVDPVP